MKKTDFFRQFHEFLEIKSISTFDEHTNLKSLEEYDSFMLMTIIAYVDDNFSTKITASQLKEITTIKSLMEIVGLKKFTE